MALEDLTGSKTIESLVENNPGSLDYRRQGDDHIRGIKNVLKNTFTNLDGIVNLTHTQINNIALIPSATGMLFFQTSAPTGWTQITTDVNDRAIRITDGAGGAVAGSDSPWSGVSITGETAVTEAQLPSHNHSITRYFQTFLTTVGGGTTNARRLTSTAGGTAFSGNDEAHSHGVTYTDLKYSDVILATRD